MSIQTPHQAAVHLLGALNCCQDCSIEHSDLRELHQLDRQKQHLAQQLKQLTFRADRVQELQTEVLQLGTLALQLQRQNESAYKIGLENIQLLKRDNYALQLTKREHIQVQLEAQRKLNVQLNDELYSLTNRVKQLNRINNEIYLNYT